ncbi:hypothetical protein L218DRAFT_796271, partial [Marasmius fiardii PR-910]
QIFGHLEPFDLLHLSRTDKDLRNLLMSKTSPLSVWKSARKNVTLHDPAPYMSEPAFAHVIFECRCH